MSLQLRIFFRQSWALAIASLKCRYRRTFAGFLWVVLSPTLTSITQALVFGYFLNIHVDDYVLFLVSGLLPWIFLSQTLEMSTPALVSHGHLMKSLPASPLIYLCAQFFDCLINFVASYLLILAPFLFFYRELYLRWLLLPLPIAILAVGVFGMALALATLNVFFRDTRFVVSFVLQILYFLTPIFYSTGMIPSQFRWLTTVNPLFQLIAPFQLLLNSGSMAEFERALASAAGVAGLLLAVGLYAWNARKELVYFYV